MLPALIKKFKVVAVNSDSPRLDPMEVNKYAMKCGYFVHPDACTPDVIAFLKTQQANLNSTFYKDWQDVAKRSELELRILQMVHYATTYGTDYRAKTFTMNDAPAGMQFSEFIILEPCTDRELFDRISALLATPVALSDELLNQLFEQLRQYRDQYGWIPDIDSVLNREAQIRLCDMLGLTPLRAENLLRLIVYKATEKSLIIKNQTTFKSLTENAAATLPLFRELTSKQLDGLAAVFYRYKPIFLALRQGFKADGSKESTQAIATINRLRRMARKLHRPARIGITESLLDPKHTLQQIREAIAQEQSLFKLVKIICYIDSINPDNVFRAYFIRNGKMFVAPNRNRYGGRLDTAQDIRAIVWEELTGRMRRKAFTADGQQLTVKFPASVELAAPISERQLVGNIPFGSVYPLRTNNLIGIYWRNEWGTRDFDLWLTAADGQRLGWSASHKDGDLLFSGDMTNADPEATEIFYGRGTSWPDSIISVARYNGEAGSKFRLFFASDDIAELPESYIVRPDSILFQEDLTSDARQTSIGIVYDRKLYFGTLGSGCSHVPDGESELAILSALSSRLGSSISLKELLLASGFTEYIESSTSAPDIDLSSPQKDTLLKLFS